MHTISMSVDGVAQKRNLSTAYEYNPTHKVTLITKKIGLQIESDIYLKNFSPRIMPQEWRVPAQP